MLRIDSFGGFIQETEYLREVDADAKSSSDSVQVLIGCLSTISRTLQENGERGDEQIEITSRYQACWWRLSSGLWKHLYSAERHMSSSLLLSTAGDTEYMLKHTRIMFHGPMDVSA